MTEAKPNDLAPAQLTEATNDPNDDCTCGEINARHCPIHQEPDDKPREWFINPVARYICAVNEGGFGLSGNEVHVIEHAAYERVCAERDEYERLAKSWMADYDRLSEKYEPKVAVTSAADREDIP